jgi:hypothetical protein
MNALPKHLVVPPNRPFAAPRRIRRRDDITPAAASR